LIDQLYLGLSTSQPCCWHLLGTANERGFQLGGGFDQRDFVLKLNKNLYGLKQAGYNWYVKLKGGMIARGFKL
jgi:hypothetical protein